MSYITVTTDVDVDIDDVLSELSYHERKDLYEELKEEFGEDSSESTSFSGATYTEQELGAALNQIWQDRFMLTKSQRERIIAITRESFIEK
jgi:hypothetical protein